MGNKALFLDRDGVVNMDTGYVHNIDDFVFVEGIFELCLKFQDNGYLIIIVTNQSGIGRGLFTEEDFKVLNDWMVEQFKERGVHIDKVYYSKALPTEHCFRRKPNPGMLLEARNEFQLRLDQSVLVGDYCINW